MYTQLVNIFKNMNCSYSFKIQHISKRFFINITNKELQNSYFGIEKSRLLITYYIKKISIFRIITIVTFQLIYILAALTSE